jgi:hypothetical protein
LSRVLPHIEAKRFADLETTAPSISSVKADAIAEINLGIRREYAEYVPPPSMIERVNSELMMASAPSA